MLEILPSSHATTHHAAQHAHRLWPVTRVACNCRYVALSHTSTVLTLASRLNSLNKGRLSEAACPANNCACSCEGAGIYSCPDPLPADCVSADAVSLYVVVKPGLIPLYSLDCCEHHPQGMLASLNLMILHTLWMRSPSSHRCTLCTCDSGC